MAKLHVTGLRNYVHATTLWVSSLRTEQPIRPAPPWTPYGEQPVGPCSSSSISLLSWKPQIPWRDERLGPFCLADNAFAQSESFLLFLECLGTKCRELSELKNRV